MDLGSAVFFTALVSLGYAGIEFLFGEVVDSFRSLEGPRQWVPPKPERPPTWKPELTALALFAAAFLLY